MNKTLRLRLIRILTLSIVIAISIYLFSIRDNIDDLRVYGYPGIFFIAILTNATVIVPMPTLIITSVMGAIFNPFWVAIIAGSGAAIGELSGYLAGVSGRGVVEHIKWHTRMEQWLNSKYGGVAILLMAFIPNPLFDMAGITAGALKLPVTNFMFWCWSGKVLKMLVFAYGGSVILRAR